MPMYGKKLFPSAPEDDVTDPFLTLLAAKAKAVGLVAGTALATAALVGGGTVAFSAVSSEGAVEDVAAADADTADTSASATPTVGIGTGSGQGVENRSDTATAVLATPSPAASVTFTCDPSKNHGQNVSAYVHSLPKGPGRGQLVSQAAKSDCGKKAGDTESEAAEVEAAEVKSPKPSKSPKAAHAKPAKSERAPKPEKAAPPRRSAKADSAQSSRKDRSAGAGKGAPEGKGGGKG